MEVQLKDLNPNPYRDFVIDPIDEQNVKALTESIKQDGFWGGIVCRRQNGHVEIGAGHHRVQAALMAGIRHADVFIGDLDDAAMIRVYAVENATQRGNTSTALAGSVASAIRFLAKAVLIGNPCIQKFLNAEQTSLEALRGHLTGDRGLGQKIIVAFLEGVPGINNGTVQNQLANLKASGDYARIIEEVQGEIERENKEALEKLARAEKAKQKADEEARRAEEARKEAAAKAKAAKEKADRERAEYERQRAEAEAKLAEKRRKEADEQMEAFDKLRQTRDSAEKAVVASKGKPRTFDFEGVAKYFKNENQVRVFREVVTGDGIAPYLPVNNQSALARRLVALANERKVELSAAFIKENVVSMVLNVRSAARQLDKEAQRRLEEQDLIIKAKRYQEDFSRNCRGMFAAGVDLLALQKKWPKNLDFPISKEFKSNLQDAKRVIDQLVHKI